MSCGGNEVQADMDSGVVVGVQYSPDLQLLLQIGLKLSIYEFHDGFIAREERREMASCACLDFDIVSPTWKCKVSSVIGPPTSTWASPCLLSGLLH